MVNVEDKTPPFDNSNNVTILSNTGLTSTSLDSSGQPPGELLHCETISTNGEVVSKSVPENVLSGSMAALRDRYFNTSSVKDKIPKGKYVEPVAPTAYPDKLSESMEVSDILRNVDIINLRHYDQVEEQQRINSCKIFMPIEINTSIKKSPVGTNSKLGFNFCAQNGDDLWTTVADEQCEQNHSYEVITDVATTGFSSPLSSIAHLSPRSAQQVPRRRTPIDLEVDKAIHKTVSQVMCLQTVSSVESLPDLETAVTRSVHLTASSLSSNSDKSGEIHEEQEDQMSLGSNSPICNAKWAERSQSASPCDELMALLESIVQSGSTMRDELDEAHLRELTVQQERSLDYDYTQCLLARLAQETASVQSENTQLQAELHVLKASTNEGAKYHKNTLQQLQLKQQNLLQQLEQKTLPVVTYDACTITDNNFVGSFVDKCVNTEGHLTIEGLNTSTANDSDIELSRSPIVGLNERDQAKFLALEAVSKRLTKKLEDAEEQKVTLQRTFSLPLKTTETQTMQCEFLSFSDGARSVLVNSVSSKNESSQYGYVNQHRAGNRAGDQMDNQVGSQLGSRVGSKAGNQMGNQGAGLSSSIATQTNLIKSIDKSIETIKTSLKLKTTISQTEPIAMNSHANVRIKNFVAPSVSPKISDAKASCKTSFAINKETQTYVRTWEKVTQTKYDEIKLNHKEVLTDLCASNMTIHVNTEICSPRPNAIAGVCRGDSGIVTDTKRCDSGLSSESGVCETECGVQTEPQILLTPNINQDELNHLLAIKQKEQLHQDEVERLKSELRQATTHMQKLAANHNKTNTEMDQVRDNIVQLQIALKHSERQKVQQMNDHQQQLTTSAQESSVLKRMITDLVDKLQAAEYHAASQVGR